MYMNKLSEKSPRHWPSLIKAHMPLLIWGTYDAIPCLLTLFILFDKLGEVFFCFLVFIASVPWTWFNNSIFPLVGSDSTIAPGASSWNCHVSTMLYDIEIVAVISAWVIGTSILLSIIILIIVLPFFKVGIKIIEILVLCVKFNAWQEVVIKLQDIQGGLTLLIIVEEKAG